MSDILMVADPSRYTSRKAAIPTLFLSAEEFFNSEDLIKQHDEILWQNFHTHGKYARIARHAEYVVVALDGKKRYLASALLVPIGAKWLLEYVMTDPQQQGQGAGSAVMDRVMHEAKKHKVEWVILNCDPKKNQGQLPRFYAKFGFTPVSVQK